ncbi:MAG: hypothetical protein K0R99_1990 [Microbacterium sp.]|uniref:iron-containing alcohol dehydrogenase n=1 Tax=Microbacterium sp. TaxID=51671 RepID=UPI00260A4D7F|nr:iron-containing alcohol dehydrogenase [Microbacterium sp.]MDF2560544.1 hypothetical protein [Microbacterium sp.]
MTAAPALGTLLTHEGTPQIVLGGGSAPRMMPSGGSKDRGILLIDSQVHDQHPQLGLHARHVFRFDPETESQRDVLERASAEVLNVDIVESADPQPRAPGHGDVVAIGGGSVMDAAKLLRLRLLSAAHFRTARHSARMFGVSILPDTWAQGARKLTLMPTTLGTGSEASAVACLVGDREDRSRRLVTGRLIRADVVVLDVALTRTLDDGAVREGVAEILLRVIGGYIGSPPSRVPDVAAEELVLRVAGLAASGIREGFDDSLRESLMLASAETHTGWTLAGRAPFSAKHWYLANELSTAGGIRKVPTTLGLLPAIWQRVLDGDRRLGDAGRLRRLWRIVAGRLGLPDDPASGAEAWRRRWGIEASSLALNVLLPAARRCFEVWANGRPALLGLTETEIVEIYVAAFRGVPLVEST